MRAGTRRLLLLGLCAGLSLLNVSPALAGWFPSETIDGPNPGILAVGGVDIAQKDGTGGTAYLRVDGDAAHVFVAPLTDGRWQAPERVDGAFGSPASSPVIAAGPSGRLVVAWITDSTLYASVRPSTGEPWSAPQAVGGPAALPALDVGLNGHGYLVWSANGDVLAARLAPGATQFAPLSTPLDIDPADPAGDAPARRATVAVAPDGLALVAWGELVGGASHVMARRVWGMDLNPLPTDLTVDQFAGRAGGDADRPDATISGDSSYGYVAYRQAFVNDNGAMVYRGLTRRMRGSRFEDPVAIDGQSFPAIDVGAPKIVENVGEDGMTVTGLGTGFIFGSTFREEHFDEVLYQPTLLLNAAPSPMADDPTISLGDNRTGLVAWNAPDGTLHARELAGDFQPEQTVSAPELGPIDVNAGVFASSDRYGDSAVVAIQDTGGERRLTAAMLDREPTHFSPRSSSVWYAQAPSRVSWSEPTDLWGGLTYTVVIDDKVVGRTRGGSYPLSGVSLRPGQHLYRIEASDIRGQVTSTPTRLIRIDSTRPHVSVAFSGTHRAGSPITVHVSASDSASGVKTPTITFGDGATARGTTVRHSFRRGTWTVTARVVNGAGMTTVSSRRISIH